VGFKILNLNYNNIFIFNLAIIFICLLRLLPLVIRIFLSEISIKNQEPEIDELYHFSNVLENSEKFTRQKKINVEYNNSNNIISKSQLSKGGITATLVDVRLIFKHSLEIGATGIVLCHNHPSGTLKASDADIKITKKIKLAAESLDITILDHLIIAEHGYLSFTDEGIL
jgi:DNA repair protein RadC